MSIDLERPSHPAHDDGPGLDVAALERDLREHVSGEVRFSDGDRALYATDASNYRQVPIGVVIPTTIDDVVAAVQVCHRHRAPIVARGAATSLAGQTCNVAVVIDFSKHLDRILEVDPDNRVARVQPGVVLDDLRDAASQHGLTFGPDPATHGHCTLGGMIGNNACGTHALMAGKTDENVEWLDVLLHDGTRMRVGPTPPEELERIVAEGGRRGEVYAALRDLRDRHMEALRTGYPVLPRRVSGYNADMLLPEKGFDVARALVGTEGTCVIVLEAGVRLVPSRPGRALAVLGYRDAPTAADAVPRLLEAGPIALEAVDDELFRLAQAKNLHPEALEVLPDAGTWLLVEFGRDEREEALEDARRLVDSLRGDPAEPDSAVVLESEEDTEKVWQVRESGLAATARRPDGVNNWPGWEDSAVPPERLGDYLRELQDLYDRYGFRASLYGHFGHGCLHTRIPFQLGTEDGIEQFRSFVYDAAELCTRYGGSLSGEHGDGQARGELLGVMYGDELMQAFREFKAVWDPDGLMNPGKVVDPRPVDGDLRLGRDYRPRPVDVVFGYPEDHEDFNQAALRCVGVGKCTQQDTSGGDVMCPSYQVTLEEKHSTRGRARLLFEMLHGRLQDRGWRSEAVRDALDLCLACKGCKSDCPVNVDMGTYKAEFLHHHYKGRLRPLSVYGLGWIPLWSRMAAVAPALANTVAATPLLAGAVKRLGGVAPERALPTFAEEPFTRWFTRRPSPPDDGRPTVLLWPDTFTTYMHPSIGKAAVQVLEAAGCRVVLPDRSVCCALPMISTGQLDVARAVLRRTLDTLADPVRAGVHVVGLEPSCTSVLSSDAHDIFPHDEVAELLQERTHTLADYLRNERPEWSPPRLDVTALVQPHCHHHAVLGTDADQELLQAAGVDVQFVRGGCCGLAGNFGFERGHYDISRAIGERVLLPRVRAADARTIVLSDGFSCRTQIEQGDTGRGAMHLAELLALGLDGRLDGRPDHPERLVERTRPPGRVGQVAALMGAGAAAAAGVGVLAAAGRRR